jgi:hypothetical protein
MITAFNVWVTGQCSYIGGTYRRYRKIIFPTGQRIGYWSQPGKMEQTCHRVLSPQLWLSHLVLRSRHIEETPSVAAGI